MKKITLFLVMLFALLASDAHAASAPAPDPAQVRATAKNAYVYGYAIVDNWKALYAFFFDTKNRLYKAPSNTLYCEANTYTPADTAVVTPNSDTPYCYVFMDLRTQPLVFHVPAIPSDRYYSIQLVDLYTYNFAYIGSRTTGNGAGDYLLIGPEWKGQTPKGITKVIRVDTYFGVAIYRTQLFNPADLPKVRAIQASYKVQTLSVFANTVGPEVPPSIIVPPYDPAKVNSPTFFGYLSALLFYAPVLHGEETLRASFAQIGVVPGNPYDFTSFSPQVQAAIEGGMADGNAAIDAALATTKSTADLYGTRAFMKDNYLNRDVGAKLGIYANSKEEASYVFYKLGPDGKQYDASKHDYTLKFAAGQLPPVNAFWSVTMYDGKTQLLVANPLNRYLINSPMLPQLKKDADGGITLYLQHDSPGKDKEANWLPAPDGLIYVAMRLYWPKPAVLNGQWTAPPLQATK